MNRQDFIQSYKNTITNMDLRIVKPFTETEIQPLYSHIWVDDIKNKINDNVNFINSSIVRSIMVMDLFDLHFSNSDENTIKTIIEFYDNKLDKLYFKDKYSLNYTNIPISSTYTNYKDYSYFIENNNAFSRIIGLLFQYCYSKWGDIFADNSYEITGPHQIKNYKIINNKFYIEENVYEILQYYNKDESITIDMFGHSIANNCLGTVILKNNKLILKDDLQNEIEYIKELNLNILNKTDIENKYLLLDSRIYRYKNTININKNLYYNALKNNIKERIINTDKLIKILDLTLQKGGF